MTTNNLNASTKYKYEFYIGCNDKDTKKDNSALILQRVQLYFLNLFGFYSMQVMHGAYTHQEEFDAGDIFGNKRDYHTVVCEKTCKIELILDDKLYDLELICASLKDLCNQESILVTCTKVNGGLF